MMVPIYNFGLTDIMFETLHVNRTHKCLRTVMNVCYFWWFIRAWLFRFLNVSLYHLYIQTQVTFDPATNPDKHTALTNIEFDVDQSQSFCSNMHKVRPQWLLHSVFRAGNN